MDLSLYICGLGNPGLTYSKNRHNVGYMFLDFLKTKYFFDEWTTFKDKIDYSKGIISKKEVLLIKPKEYMNNSGKSLKFFFEYYKIDINKVVVVYDDVDINIGSFKIRKKGSGGSHNGMNDIILNLKTQDIIRVRIGIGPKPTQIELKDFVLSNFTYDEMKKINEVFEKLSFVFIDLLNKNIDYVISRYGSV